MKKAITILILIFTVSFAAVASESKVYIGFDMGYSLNQDDKFTDGPSFGIYGTYYFNDYLGVSVLGYTNELGMDGKELFIRSMALGVTGRYEIKDWLDLGGTVAAAYTGSSEKEREPTVHPKNTFGGYMDLGVHFFPHEHYYLRVMARYFYAESEDKSLPDEYDFSHFGLVVGVGVAF